MSFGSGQTQFVFLEFFRLLNRMKIEDLEKNINYTFINKNLLKEALTHSSSHLSKTYFKENNKKFNYERLEFLGDRVLGLILADHFYNFFENFNEGNLNDFFQKYANQDFLSDFAITLNISDFISVQKGDSLINNKSVLGDVVEAIIGAIYIDTGIQNCKKFIIEKMLCSFNDDFLPLKNSKSILQELSLKKFKLLPKYNIINKSGHDHKPTFKVSVSIDEMICNANGDNLQAAEQKAASKLLNLINKTS